MMFVLFNVKDNIDKVKCEKRYFEENKYLVEVCISKDYLNKRLKEKKNFFKTIKDIHIDKRIKKEILKALENVDTKWYYTLSCEILECDNYRKYLENLCNSMLGYKYIVSSQMQQNAIKHIKQNANKNNLKLTNLKMLLVYNREDINFDFVKKLISEIKTVNIYKTNISKYAEKQIAKINSEEGTSIEIIKKDKKSFQEYDVVYFVDAKKQDYPRFRINKKAQVIDIDTEDIFNSNIVVLNDYLNDENNLKCISVVQNLIESYGKYVIGAYINKVKSTY